jgi:hypothetical protein
VTDVYPKDATIPPGEEWYYEIDGRAHGPLSRTDLEELLNRGGETASEIRVRQGTDGPWSPFSSASPAAGATRLPESTLEPGRRRPESIAKVSAHRPTSQVATSGLRSLLHRHWDIGAAIGAWILLNGSLLLFWPQSYARERRYLQTLQAINADVQDLRAKPASDEEWHQFAERTRQTLAPIVTDLKKSASSTEPVRQQLLWSARDLIPRTIGPRNKDRDELEQRLKQYLDKAQRELETK